MDLRESASAHLSPFGLFVASYLKGGVYYFYPRTISVLMPVALLQVWRATGPGLRSTPQWERGL